jgi:methylglutaconyl-CoA hydratase
MNDVMVRELGAAFDALEADATVRAVVLAGRGPAFCAGADLKHMKKMSGASAHENERDAAALSGMFHKLATLAKPTLARVHGAAYAGGIGLVCSCDIAVAAQDTRFCLSEVRLGLAAASMAAQLVRAIGERQASRYVLSAEEFTAAEAYRIGLVQELALAEELDGVVNGLLGQLVRGAPGAQAAAKELLRSLAASAHGAARVTGGAKRFAALRASEEFREGLAAFLEKRDPAWLNTGDGKPRGTRAGRKA